MRIIRAKNYDDLSKKAANIIASQVILKPGSVLGLATGSSPIGTYKYLVEKYQQGDLDFSNVTTVNLDEYKGLSRDHDQSYYYFMHEHLFDHVNIDQKKTFLPDGTQADSEKACADYDQIIAGIGGVDIQLLGIGHNGHIGFNEPDTIFKKGTHCVNLSEETIQANKRFFASADDVPRQAYTMGIGAIMSARKILLVVSGEEKAKAVKEAFFGPVTPAVQASILQLRKHVIVVADEAALSQVSI